MSLNPSVPNYTAALPPSAAAITDNVLRVLVSGGGPVGLGFALLLEAAMGPRVAITVYDGRWMHAGKQITWKGNSEGNARRLQVVTIQSRHFLAFEPAARQFLFQSGGCSEMWPTGPDSVENLPPINISIAHFENQLLALANMRSTNIRLVPQRFDPRTHFSKLEQHQVLAICEGSRSESDGTLQHFTVNFGKADSTIFTLYGEHLEDVVLGLRVKSALPDPTAVLLTVAQNRFLLNAVGGEGFLNMRLTDEEAKSMAHLRSGESVRAIDISPVLWQRILEGLALFAVEPEDLTAIMLFRVRMVQRPRFTAQLFQPTAETAGTYGFLLGDSANAVHFWPGRGLNSGLASAISLTSCLKTQWRGVRFRDADFLRHEAIMAMLQYRHKSRAWRFMVGADEAGAPMSIKEKMLWALEDVALGRADREADMHELLKRLDGIRQRLSKRLTGLPDDEGLQHRLSTLSDGMLRVLVASGPWDAFGVGGEEVDVNSMFDKPDHQECRISTPPQPAT